MNVDIVNKPGFARLHYDKTGTGPGQGFIGKDHSKKRRVNQELNLKA